MSNSKLLAAITSGLLVSALSVAGSGAQAASAAAAAPPACADSWTNSAGGTWSTGSDWSTGTPPTSSQYACITIALSAPVVLSGDATTGGLTVGGTSGTAALELAGATLALLSASSVTRTGEIATESSGATIEVASSAALTNDGVIEAAGNYLDLYGNVTNKADGWVSVSSTLALDTGTLTNSGQLTVQPGGTLEAPANGGTGAVIDNARGAIQNRGTVDVGQGATFEEGAGSVVGTPPVIGSGGGGALDLTGSGASTFELQGSCCEIPTVSGNVATGQTLLLAGTVEATGSFTNDGTVTTAGNSTLVLPAADTITNGGSIVVAPGFGLTLAANIDNQVKGAITLAAGSGSASSLALSGAVTLTNDGTVTIGSSSSANYSSLNAGSDGTIDNAGGTIANAGAVTINRGAAFTEGSGATTGNPVSVDAGALHLTGGGASSFWMYGTASISGNIAAGQTVAEGGVNAAGSFTNNGTLIGRNGPLSLPSGDTVTNDGTIEATSGFEVNGNLTNSASGVIGEQSNVSLTDGTGNTFDNAGTLYLLPNGEVNLDCNQGYANNTFVNTGTIYWGIDSSGVEWGGDAFGSSSVCGGSGSTVDIGGTVVPVPIGEPSGGSGPIAYSVGPSTSTITWSPSVTSGWSAGSGYLGAAALIEPESTTVEPTKVSVSGSGTPISNNNGWQSTYGQPVTFTATVSAANGSAPTGTVTFFAVQQNSGIPFAIGPDLLGTGTLSTTGGVTTATLTTSSLPAGSYELAALYRGDSADLAAWSQYTFGASPGNVQQVVSAQTTTTGLTSSSSSPVFGFPLTLTATVIPGAYGPAKPTGIVTFFDGSTILGQAQVATSKGITTAKVTTTSLPVGSDSLSADYAGDYNYGGSTSSPLSQSVSAPTAPTTVTVTGPASVKAGSTYKATAGTDGTGAVLFAAPSTPAPPAGMTINAITGAVSYKVPGSGVSSFSYAVVVSNAAGQAESQVITVKVT